MSAQLSVTSAFNDLFAIGAANVLNGFSLGMPLFGIDPIYADADSADYHLKGTSTLINAGTITPPGGLPALDADGNLRVANGIVDIGAFEFGSTPPPTTTTTVVTSSTTTTTLACTAEATVASVSCRLDTLIADIGAQVPAGKLHDKLLAQLATAEAALQDGSAATSKGSRKRAFKRVVKSLAGARARLNTKLAKALDATLRGTVGARLVALREIRRRSGRARSVPAAHLPSGSRPRCRSMDARRRRGARSGLAVTCDACSASAVRASSATARRAFLVLSCACRRLSAASARLKPLRRARPVCRAVASADARLVAIDPASRSRSRPAGTPLVTATLS